MTKTEIQRNDTIEFVRMYCVHYNPSRDIKSDYCSIGCNSKQKINSFQMSGAKHWEPCIGGHNNSNVLMMCPKWERISMENAQKRADDFQAAMDRVDITTPVVDEWRTKPKPSKDRRDVIKCPACSGKLHLSQSSYNGHVSAICDTNGCVSWRE